MLHEITLWKVSLFAREMDSTMEDATAATPTVSSELPPPPPPNANPNSELPSSDPPKTREEGELSSDDDDDDVCSSPQTLVFENLILVPIPFVSKRS